MMQFKQDMLIPTAEWQPDKSTEECSGKNCSTRFSYLLGVRKHHCRYCGKIFCDSCAPLRPIIGGTPLLCGNYTEARRCQWCRLPRCFYATRHTSCAKMDGRPMDIILSFLDNNSINALLQTYTGTLYRFHLQDIPCFESLQDRFPSLYTGAQIGKGAFGVVYMVEDRSRNGVQVAVKVICKKTVRSYWAWLKLRREIDIMAGNKHDNVACLYDVLQTPTELAMVTEVGDGGTLKQAYDYILKNKLSVEVFTAYVVCQISRGLQYLHNVRNIAHRDVKHDNIVLSRDYSRVMIIDFGLAETVDSDTGSYFPCGTMGFASPENIACVVQMKKKFIATRQAMYATDMFSLGVVAFCLLSKKRPLRGTKFIHQHEELKMGIRCEGPSWERISSDAKSMVEHLLHSSYIHRATPEIIEHHRFIKRQAHLFSNMEEVRRAEIQRQKERVEREWDIISDTSMEWEVINISIDNNCTEYCVV